MDKHERERLLEEIETLRDIIAAEREIRAGLGVDHKTGMARIRARLVAVRPESKKGKKS